LFGANNSFIVIVDLSELAGPLLHLEAVKFATIARVLIDVP